MNNLSFQSPYILLTLLLIPIIILYKYKITKSPTILFSSTTNAKKIAPSLRLRLIFLPNLLRSLALALLIIAIARPRKGIEQIEDYNKGIAIEAVIDCSSSMRQKMTYNNKTTNRLEASKQAFSQFAKGDKHNLKGRPNDLLGMITFARNPTTICPLTIGPEIVTSFLEQVERVKYRQEDGTAIYDALALAAARLKNVEKNLQQNDKHKKNNYKIKSKIIILMTDGNNNQGDFSIEKVCQLLKKWHIKVYAIAIGNNDYTPSGFFNMTSRINMQPLQEIATQTGGFAKLIHNATDLKEIYKKIDKLEQSEIQSKKFIKYKEQFLLPATIALTLLLLEIILRTTILRRN